MKCPRCTTETPSEALCCPSCKLITPIGRIYRQNKDVRQRVQETRAIAREEAEEAEEPKKIRYVVAGIVILMTILICGLGSYVMITYWQISAPDPGDHPQLALDKVRKLPSKQQGLSVEEYLDQELEKAREAGLILEAEGWDVRPIEGARFLVSFTYQLKDRTQQKARWEVDIAENTFLPQTELATAVSGNN